MKEINVEQFKLIFNLIERYHTIVTDAFPHEGLKIIGGSRVALQGPLMKVLEACVDEITREIKKPTVNGVWNDIIALWCEIAKLLKRIKGCDLNKKDTNQFDKAVILMYLASGITWNYTCKLAGEEPPHNPQYVRVEPMLPLLTRCGWDGENEANIDPGQLVRRLQSELKICLH